MGNTYIWIAPGSGSWASASDWANLTTAQTPAGPPGAGDSAYVDTAADISGNGAAGTLTVGASSASISGVITAGTANLSGGVSGGSFEVSSSGGSLAVTSDLIVGQSLQLDIFGAVTGPAAGQVGVQDFGTVDVEAGGSIAGGGRFTSYATLLVQGSVTVQTLEVYGVTGDAGSLDLSGAGSIFDTYAILGIVSNGFDFDQSNVTIAGGTWTSMALLVASQGTVTLSVSGGSTVTAIGGATLVAGEPPLVIGDQGGALGTVTVSGANSLVSATGGAWLGNAGTAEITLSSGGSLAVNGSLDAGVAATGIATLTIGGAASLNVAGNATIGDAGNAAVTIATGGTLTIAGTLDIAVQQNATGTLSLADIGTISGDAYLGDAGLAQLTLATTGSLHVGGTFDAGVLINGGASISVTGSLSRLTLAQNATFGDAGNLWLDIAGGHVSVGGSLAVGAQTTGAGTLIVAGGAELSVDGGGILGNAGAADLTVSSDGSFGVTGSLDIAATANGTATLDVTGDGSVLQGGTDVTLGDGGTASATVESGGSLSVGGVLALGGSANGQGNLIIVGGSVQVTGGMSLGDGAAGNLTLGVGGALSVGGTLSEGVQQGGSGSLLVTDASAQLTLLSDWIIGVASTHADTISAAASLSLAGALTLGDSSSGDGTLTLSGGASLAVGLGLTLGDAGSGSLEIDDGSTLSTAGTLDLGAQSDGDGTLTLTGSADLAAGTKATVGDAGAGEIDIGQGATFTLASTLTLGATKNAAGTITLGQGATLAPGGNLTVGNAGTGAIDLAASATLDGSAGTFVLGATANGSGTVSLGGSSAEISSGDLVVGGGGAGLITVGADTTLSASGDLTLGQSHGASGTITVAGSGDLEGGGTLTVGAAGAGSLDVSGGSLSGVSDLSIGDAAGGSGDVTFAQATLSLGTLTVGNAGAGTFSANTTADVTATTVVLGAQSGGTGTFNLDGQSSEVQAGSLAIGEGGAGALQVSNSAALQISGAATMGGQSGALTQQTATIESNASWTIGGLLAVGEAASGAVTVGTGGQVAAASVVLGDRVGASGTVAATGTGTAPSAFGFGSLLKVGNFGTGEFSLAAGAEAGTGTTSGTVEIAAGTHAIGGVTLTGAGTILQAQLVSVGGGATTAGGAGVLGIGTGAEVAVAAATIWGSGNVVLAGGTLTTGPIAVLGTVSGFGVLNGTVTDSGRIAASGGTLAIAGAVTGAGTLSVASGSELWLQAGAAALTVAMATSDAVLRLGALAATHASVKGFAHGDTILVDGVTADAGTLANGTLTLRQGGVTTGTIALAGPNGTPFHVSTANGQTTIFEIPCFAAGTRILTEFGETPVEHLRVGQRVRTARGDVFRPIVWLGHRRADCARHPRPHDVRPVRVLRGAFGESRPARDLLLSPDHAVFFRGVLIPVRYLINGATIRQEAVPKITYWHVELDRHDILLAEHLPCESYLDTGNRAAFANGGGSVHMHPDFARAVWQARGCAKLALPGPAVTAIRRRLLRRAAALGYALTEEADVRLEADGQKLAWARGRRWHVLLPQGARKLRLRSRSWVPGHTRAGENDTRRLGVAITRLALDGRSLSPDDPRLGSGWHAPEADWRWTDGDACLRINGEYRIEFDLVMAGTYWRDPPDAA